MTTHHREGYLIHTHGWAKPIPDRRYDWCATLDSYEPGMPVGCGATEEAAIQDLLELIRSEEELPTPVVQVETIGESKFTGDQVMAALAKAIKR